MECKESQRERYSLNGTDQAREDDTMLDVQSTKRPGNICGIKCFTCIASAMVSLYISSLYYFIGAIRMLEKQYGFSSTTTGFLSIADNISSVPILLVFGYMGDKISKAKIIGVGGVILSLSYILHALPYFVDNTRFSDTGLLANLSNVENITYHQVKYKDMFCEIKPENNSCNLDTIRVAYDNSGTFGILLAARLLFGLGGTALLPLAQAYMYESLGKRAMSTYLGFLSSVISVGHVTGLGIAAFCTRIPIDLKDYSLPPQDPRFLGAWWFGFLIYAVIVLVCSFAMFFFPATLSPRRALNTERDIKKKQMLDNVKEAVHAMRRLLSSYLFLLFVVSYCLAMYTIIAVAMNMQRYIEVHFRVPIFNANLITGLSGAGTGLIGALAGGYVTSRLSIRNSRVALLNFIVIVLITIVLGVMMSLRCDQVTYAGSSHMVGENRLNLTTPCSVECDCDLSVSQPVCGADGKNYFTPCHGGCTGRHGNNVTGCSCIPGGAGNVGLCETTCDRMIAYIVILGVLSVLVGFSVVPRNVIILRVAPARQKSFAMGFNGFFYNLIAFIPGPVIFGKLIDSTCLIWQQKCGQRGSCFLYNTDRLRNLIHGAGIGINTVGSVLLFIGWRIIISGRGMDDEEEVPGETGNDERYTLDNKTTQEV